MQFLIWTTGGGRAVTSRRKPTKKKNALNLKFEEERASVSGRCGFAFSYFRIQQEILCPSRRKWVFLRANATNEAETLSG